jgi:GNAT superfamily N-acetyltransferase
MKAIFFDSASDFLQLVRPALDKDEAANNLMYGLALRLERAPERFQQPPYRWPPLLAAVMEGSELASAALMTPPYNIIVFSPRPQKTGVFAALAGDLQARAWSIPGVLGPSAEALEFAAAWSAQTGAAIRPGMRERVYELRQVILPPQPPGRMRLADDGDIDLLARWVFAFWKEAVPREVSTFQDAEHMAEVKVEEGDFFVWDNGRPVALAGKARPTPHGTCIGPVYTPPQQRAHGYATALTAALSQRLLDQGCQFTALFTDLSNPTSNSIYQKIGYRPLCDFNEFIFD